MKITENFLASDHVIRETERSKIDETGKITSTSGYRCPHCYARLHCLEHGEITHCKCGLKIQRFGNCLECTIDKKDLHGKVIHNFRSSAEMESSSGYRTPANQTVGSR